MGVARLVLLGHPVAHSLSPRFQNAALRAAGIPIEYSALDVEPSMLEDVVAELKRERVAGNVTVPFKERVHDLCDVLTPTAQRAGAVNTFWVTGQGDLVGDNTDVDGFDYAVRLVLGESPRDQTIGILGAGGAAAAVLTAVEKWAGCHAHIFNRTPERARLLAERFGSIAQPVDDIGVIAGSQIVVNATSIGLRDDALPVDVELLSPETTVVDLVYRPGETALVRAARKRGLRAVDGLPMLCEQGAVAFERWFGRPPDRAVMWRALTESSPAS